MKRRAGSVSLLEVLAVLVIMAILAQLLQPVVAKSVLAAKRSRSEQRLRNLATAMELYRGDHGETGGPSEIGLPLVDDWWESYGIPYEEAVYTGGYPRGHGGGTIGPGMYRRLYPNPFEIEMQWNIGGEELVVKHREAWREHLRATGNTAVLYIDDTFFPMEERFGPFYVKPVFAVFTDGHIERKNVRGQFPYPETRLWNE